MNVLEHLGVGFGVAFTPEAERKRCSSSEMLSPVSDSRTGGTWVITRASSAVIFDTPTSPLPPVFTMVMRSMRASGSAIALAISGNTGASSCSTAASLY